jgi:hypothetical protein
VARPLAHDGDGRVGVLHQGQHSRQPGWMAAMEQAEVSDGRVA